MLLSEHTLNEDYYDGFDDDNFMEEDGPKAQLLREIDTAGAESIETGGPRFGFGVGFGGAENSGEDSSSQKIAKLVDDVSGYVLPLQKPSRWRLLYNNVPDVLGCEGGPLSRLVSIRQTVVDADRLDIEPEYKSSGGIVWLFSSFLEGVEDEIWCKRFDSTTRSG